MKKLLKDFAVSLAVAIAMLASVSIVTKAHAQGVPINCPSAALAYTAATHSYACNNAPNFTTSVTSPIATLTADTWANVSAGGVAGQMRRVSDIGRASFGSLWCYGTRWAPCGGAVMLATLGNPTGNIANSETIVLQALIPAGAWQTNDTLRVRVTLTKSGTTDALVFRIRIGTAGTTADTAITGTGGNVLGAGGQSIGALFDVKLISATSALKVGAGSVSSPSYAPASASAAAAATTISSASANALYISASIASSSTNDTVTMQSGQIQLITP